ncbi:Sensor protein FixL [Posidoniimonas polymericola]|uniref:histidine kinase n=1 Tax=Posidoniimonas polymericola TaxID=2528002 RepID=A0A5C5YQB8_9BACT|nr:ATP-binding protein [Posidoniimonas polymericola]TWT77124.1 Sensor protein FixL [Posidoniimonas polymericola]
MAEPLPQTADKGAQIRRKLTARTLVALAVSGGILLAEQLHTYQGLRHRLVDAELINSFGRQRMLSQRIAKHLYALRDANSTAPQLLDDLSRTQAEFDAGHQRLLDWIPEEEDPTRRMELERMAAQLTPIADKINNAVGAMTDRGGDAAEATPIDNELAGLIASCDEFCAMMEEVTGGQSTHLQANLGADAWTRTILQVSLLGGLAVLLIMLVIPTIAHAAESHRKLADELANSLVQQAKQEKLASEIRRMSALDHAVLETAADSIVVIDKTGTILSANGAAHRTFVAEPGSLVGSNVARLMPEPHAGNHDGYVRHHLDTGEKRIIGTTRELVARRLNGEAFPMELSVASTIVDGDVYFTGFVRDISERKRLELRLLQSEKLSSVGRLAAGIAHEMNTPLQFISVNTKFLQESLEALVKGPRRPIGEPARPSIDTDFCTMLECIDENIEGVTRLVDIVRSMQEFSHPGDLRNSSFDLNHCVESVLKISRNRWKHVACLDLRLGKDLPPCEGSSNEIGQVILNLIVNAADAIAEQRGVDPAELGSITIRTTQEGGNLLLEVGDDGPGIPADVLPQIFEPFFTTKPVGAGTGQGLAIAYDIVVNKHGGALDAESAVGAGCWFTVTLPVSRPDPAVQEVDSLVSPAAPETTAP